MSINIQKKEICLVISSPRNPLKPPQESQEFIGEASLSNRDNRCSPYSVVPLKTSLRNPPSYYSTSGVMQFSSGLKLKINK